MNLRNLINQKKGEKNILERELSKAKSQKLEAEKSLKRHERALAIVKEVGLKTQQQLQYHIGDIASLALESVFYDNAYQLEVEFVDRRGKTECDIFFTRDGQRMDPQSDSGGGAVDVASFALRIASWSMTNPKLRNTIILDEPMRFLSSDLQPQASKMIKQLSEKLGLQFIIVTHEDELAQEADRVFKVTQPNKKSKVVIL